MPQSTISPRQYKAAHYSVSKIAPVLEVLEKIDLQALNYNTDAAEKLAELNRFLTDLNEQHKFVILTGDDQYDRRPVELIQKAAARMMAIPVKILEEQKRIAAKLETRQMKAEELAKRFSAAEIDRIVPPVPQSEIDASAAAINALEAEAAAIEAFLSDAPRYDLELLQNTTVYPKKRGLTNESTAN